VIYVLLMHGASPAPKGVEAFHIYTIVSAKDLIPEMENTAHLTLDHLMTFEVLGEGLQLFEGWAAAAVCVSKQV
jgi:hypothetical protein